MDFTTLSGEALTEALALDFASLDNDAIAAAHSERTTAIFALLSLETPTISQVNDVEALIASVRAIEEEQATRSAVAEDAAKRFAAIRSSFSAEAEDAEAEGIEDESTDEGSESVEASAEEATDEDAEAEENAEETEAVVTASTNMALSQTVKAGSVARKVGAKTSRPAVAVARPVVITAAADIPNVPMGFHMEGLDAVAEALMARAKGYAPFNLSAARAANSASGGAPVLTKHAVASFGLEFAEGSISSKKRDVSSDHNAVKAAVDLHQRKISASITAALSGRDVSQQTLTAAGWCAPSEVVYNWIADFVVDGLLSLPEVGAPRGGLMITEGPQLLQTTYADTDNFGFGGTEAEAIAGDFNKVCETIVCPDFEDHRLDFVGYCWKIPLLTEAAFPELIADALRVANVAWAHKMNKRKIDDILDLSTLVNATPYGGSFTDTIEALTQIAVKERRWWNLGENATMEVKLPQFVRDVFKFDMARRSGLALNDIATDQKIAAHFANHNLAVEYLSDFEDLSGPAAAQADWPGKFTALIYPSGTFATSTNDVINISAVHDAASLAENEYTGVFFEQGYMTFKRGYRAHHVEVPVCTSGTTGANAFMCEGGSF